MANSHSIAMSTGASVRLKKMTTGKPNANPQNNKNLILIFSVPYSTHPAPAPSISQNGSKFNMSIDFSSFRQDVAIDVGAGPVALRIQLVRER
jgi:hypothetical protein